MIVSRVVKAGLLLISAFAVLPHSANAQCGQWDVSGKWILKVIQGASENMDLTQSGTDIRGKVLADIGGALVIGKVDGDDFSISVDWTSPGRQFPTSVFPIEAFTGRIAADGTIHGFGTTLAHRDLSGKSNEWSSDRPMKCMTHHYAGPVRHTGHPAVVDQPKAPENVSEQSIQPTSSVLTIPGIIATPNHIALMKGKAKGVTTLTWDAGRAHQSAEVWVRVDDEDETKVAATGKGSLLLPVEPGKSYLYILKDGSRTLASLVVEYHR